LPTRSTLSLHDALPISGLVGSALLGLPLLANVAGTALQIAFFAFFARHLAFAVAALDSAPADLAAPLIDTGWQPPVSVLVACKKDRKSTRLNSSHQIIS